MQPGKTLSKTPGETLAKAHHLVTRDRAEEHGDMRILFSLIAAEWETYLEHPISAYDVAMCMAKLKIARETVSPGNPDNLIDAAGYLDIAAVLKDG